MRWRRSAAIIALLALVAHAAFSLRHRDPLDPSPLESCGERSIDAETATTQELRVVNDCLERNQPRCTYEADGWIDPSGDWNCPACREGCSGCMCTGLPNHTLAFARGYALVPFLWMFRWGQ